MECVWDRWPARSIDFCAESAAVSENSRVMTTSVGVRACDAYGRHRQYHGPVEPKYQPYILLGLTSSIYARRTRAHSLTPLCRRETKQRGMAGQAPPVWAVLLIFILGFNELMATVSFVSNPANLMMVFLGLIVMGALYALHALHLMGMPSIFFASPARLACLTRTGSSLLNRCMTKPSLRSSAHRCMPALLHALQLALALVPHACYSLSLELCMHTHTLRPAPEEHMATLLRPSPCCFLTPVCRTLCVHCR